MTLVAVVGGGQLGQMLALAGIPLGLRCRFLDPDPGCPAARVGELVVGAYDDPQALAKLVEGAEVVTFEFENVPSAATEWLEAHAGIPVRPGSKALATGQERLLEKRLLQACGMPTAPFEPIDDLAGAVRAAEAIGLPAILKTRRHGYDGKGQIAITEVGMDAVTAVCEAWTALGGRPCVLERMVSFRREVSVIAARAIDGATVVYPPIENVHGGGILRRSRVPVEGAPHALGPLAEAVAAHARGLLEALDYVGVLCIEFFEADGVLLANEFAPRVHNSGHWTIEGAETSQFENHLRAILGWPLGSTAARGPAAMVNLIGAAPPIARLLEIPGANIHLYGKAPRQGRKLGHVTVVAASEAELAARLARVTEVVAVKDAR